MAESDSGVVYFCSAEESISTADALSPKTSRWASYYFPIFWICIFWGFFISWRPWRLGFYHDDWSLLTVTSTYGIPLIEGGRTRPLNVALGYLGVTFFKNDAFLWHFYGALLVLTTAICLYGCCYSLTRKVLDKDGAARTGALVAAIAWMLYPWSLGYTAWPVMFPGLVSVLFFLIATWVLVESPCNAQRIRLSCYSVVFSTLIYEAFWFSFLPLACLALVCDPKKDWKNAARVLITIGAVQLLLVGWYLLIGYWGGSGGKAINYAFLDIVANIPFRLVTGLRFDGKFVTPLIYSTALLLLLLIWRAFQRKNIALVLMAAAIGVLTSVMLYALAGYAMATSGIFSRTFIAVNVWLSFAISVLVGLFFNSARGVSKGAGTAFLLSSLILLGMGNISETNRWTESWEFQRAFLSKIPVHEIEAINTHSAIVLLLPNRIGKIESLGAFWDAAAALYVTYPSLRDPIQNGQLWITVSRDNEWLTKWDGSTVSQYWCAFATVPLWTHKATNVFGLDSIKNELHVLQPPWAHGCPGD